MRAVHLLCGCLLLSALAGLDGCDPDRTSSPDQAPGHDGSSAHDSVGPVPEAKSPMPDASKQESLPATAVTPPELLVFAGDAAAIGKAHGTALEKDIHDLVEKWLRSKTGMLGIVSELFFNWKASTMASSIPEWLRTEMTAVGKATGFDWQTVLNANAFPDVVELLANGAPFGCSTFVVLPGRSSTGAMIHGRNLDYLESEEVRRRWRPMVFSRTSRHRLLLLGIPGISGVLTGINDRGVMMSRNQAYHGDARSKGVPSMLLFRMILEEARTAEEAKDLYLKHARTVPIVVTISDPQKALILEVTAKKHAVVLPHKGILRAANHFQSSQLSNGKKIDWRWKLIKKHDGSSSPIGLTQVRDLMGEVGYKDGGNILAVVMDYGSWRMYYGTDAPKAALGALRVIDVKAALGL